MGPSGEIATRSRPVPQEAWRVVIRDHHEGYIDWDRFVANRASPRRQPHQSTKSWPDQPERDFACCRACLLCGACGRRLGVRYTGNGGVYPIYQCIWKHREALSSRACLSCAVHAARPCYRRALVGRRSRR